MYQTLMNLYNGNLDFQKRSHDPLPLEKYHRKEYDRIKSHLEKALNEDDKKLLIYHDKDNLLENKEQYLRNFLHQPFVSIPSTMDELLAKQYTQ